jgi:putative ABC transport system permease protein
LDQALAGRVQNTRDTTMNDIRYALRSFSRTPGFALIAILTVALGIAVNTAIFSIVNAALLEPLPYRDPARLVVVQERIPKISAKFFNVSAPDVPDIRAWSRSLDAVAAYETESLNLSGGAIPKRVVRFQGRQPISTRGTVRARRRSRL